MMGGWEIIEAESRHVLPVNDIEEHELSSTCRCEPKVDVAKDGTMIIIHMAFDQRHIVEQLLGQ